MIRPIQSCFNVSHVDRNLGTASLSVHRAGFCDYIHIFIIIIVNALLLVYFVFVYFMHMAMMTKIRLVSQHSQ